MAFVQKVMKGGVKYSVFRPRCFSRIWTLSSPQIEKRSLMGFVFSKSTTSTFLSSGHEKRPILENTAINAKNEDDVTFIIPWSRFEANIMVNRHIFTSNDSTSTSHILRTWCGIRKTLQIVVQWQRWYPWKAQVYPWVKISIKCNGGTNYEK